MKVKAFISKQLKRFILYFADGKYNQDVLLEQFIVFYSLIFSLEVSVFDCDLYEIIIVNFAKPYLLINAVIILLGIITRKILLRQRAK